MSITTSTKKNLPMPQKTSKFPSPKLTWQTKIDSSDVGLKSINIHQSGQCTGHLPGNQGYACTDGATEASDFFLDFPAVQNDYTRFHT